MSKLNLNLPSINTESSIEGVWVNYEEGISFRIARLNTPGYNAAIKKINRLYSRQIEKATLSDEKSDGLMAEAIAAHVLIDWKGLKTDEDEFVYSRENAEAFLKAPEYFEIRGWIMAQAGDLANYRQEIGKK